MRTAAVLAVLLAVGGCSREITQAPAPESNPAAEPAPVAKPEEPATLRGVVRWVGPRPEQRRIVMSGDPFLVGAWPDGGPPDPRFEVAADGALPHAFVWAVKGQHEGRTWAAPTERAELGADRGMYVPHVLGIRCGQPLVLTSRDNWHCNFHLRPKINPLDFNICVQGDSMMGAAGGKPLSGRNVNVVRFDRPELAINVSHDVDSWMNAWVFVLDHPFFATTDAAGRFEIRGLPPGDYVFAVWHEPMIDYAKVHEAETRVTLASGAVVDVAVELR